jgi:hypothetical protein
MVRLLDHKANLKQESIPGLVELLINNLVKFESKLKTLFLIIEGKDIINLDWRSSIHIIHTDVSTIQKTISQPKELLQSSFKKAIKHLLTVQINPGNSNPRNHQLSSGALQIFPQIIWAHFQESISDSY